MDIEILKLMQWEIAKGNLKAICPLMDGDEIDHEGKTIVWEETEYKRFQKKVEKFVREMNNEFGL